MPARGDPPPWSIVLAPLDQGVRNVGGRDGAAQGPQRLVDALREEGAVPEEADVRVPELGNDPSSLERDLDRISQAVEDVLARGRRVLVFGGDHGTTYATVRGAARALGRVGVVYLDVHLDVRGFEPVHTSGSSFRRLVDEELVAPEHVRPIGIQPPEDPDASSGAKASFSELADWADRAGVRWRSIAEARAEQLGEAVWRALERGPRWCFSLDVDCLDESFAPGVSAPGGGRFRPEEVAPALSAAFERCPVVDVAEYAPRLDDEDRTLGTLVELLAPELSRLRWVDRSGQRPAGSG